MNRNEKKLSKANKPTNQFYITAYNTFLHSDRRMTRRFTLLEVHDLNDYSSIIDPCSNLLKYAFLLLLLPHYFIWLTKDGKYVMRVS